MSRPTYPDCPDPDSFESGLRYQDFVTKEVYRHLGLVLQNHNSKLYQLTIGENPQRVEIKLDRRWPQHRRLSIEIAEKFQASQPTWTPSGIWTPNNTWLYIQGNYERFWIFERKMLRQLHSLPQYRKSEAATATIRKFYLYYDDANKYASQVVQVDGHEGVVPDPNNPPQTMKPQNRLPGIP
jgi:hypothetical protein